MTEAVQALVRLVQATPSSPGECVRHLIQSGHPRHAAEAAFRQAVDGGVLVPDRYIVLRAGPGAEARRRA